MNSVFRWLFEDRGTGRIVIGQMPNASLWIALAALVTSFVVPRGRVETATRIVLYAALGYWAFDELIRGVNPWRRILGVVTLVAVVAWLIVQR